MRRRAVSRAKRPRIGTTKPGEARHRLSPVEKFKPLDPSKPLAPYHLAAPGHAKFKDIPGRLTLEDMGMISSNEEEDHA
jgi:hypothetical protein